MKAAMYIFLNKGLGMSTGKSSAQAGHAAVEAALLSHPTTAGETDNATWIERSKLWEAWRSGLHYAKYVMEARDEQHLETIEKYLVARGFRTHLVIDEGHTEVLPLTITALGVALVDKDDPHTKDTFSSFKLYRDPKPPEPDPDENPPLAPVIPLFPNYPLFPSPMQPYETPPITTPSPWSPPSTTPGFPWQRPIITCRSDDDSNTA